MGKHINSVLFSFVDGSVRPIKKAPDMNNFLYASAIADGQVINCEVMDISVGGVSLKSEVRPPLGEYVLIASMAGQVARHHEHGIGIEFIGQDKSAPPSAGPAHKLNLVR